MLDTKNINPQTTSDPADIGKRIQEARKRKGLKQMQLAKELGIGVSALRLYERGDRTAPIPVLVKICRFFDISAGWLLGLPKQEDTEDAADAGADNSAINGEGILGSEDPEGVQDLAGSEETDASERQYIEPQKGKNPIDILLDMAGEALDEFFKQNIIRKFVRVIESAGLTPEPELLERLQAATLKEISEIAVGFPAYIIAATLEKGSNENKNT